MFGVILQLTRLRGPPVLMQLAAKKHCLPLSPSTCFVAGTADPWFMHDDSKFNVPEPFDHFDPVHDPKYPAGMRTEWISQHGTG